MTLHHINHICIMGSVDMHALISKCWYCNLWDFHTSCYLAWKGLIYIYLFSYNAGKYSVSFSVSTAYSFFSKEWTKGICGKKMDRLDWRDWEVFQWKEMAIQVLYCPPQPPPQLCGKNFHLWFNYYKDTFSCFAAKLALQKEQW